jgi:hypothetical protein
MRNEGILSKKLGFRPQLGKYCFILLLGCLLLAVTSISCSHPSQNRRRIPEPKEAKPADQIISGMKTSLGLTDEQENNIRPIIEQQVIKRNELIKKYKGLGQKGLDFLRDDLKDLRISTESQLQYFLANEQMIQYGELQREEDQRIAGNSSGRTQEETTQEKPKSRGRRSGRF